MWYQPWTAGSVVAVVSTHGNRGLEEGKKQEEQHAKKGKMEKMEQIIYEQAFKEHCVTSNNKMKGKKHLKWVALFRRHASSSKAMSLRKTVNFFFFFSRTLPEQLLVVAKSWEHEMGRTPTPTLLLVSTKTEAQDQHTELQHTELMLRKYFCFYTFKHCLHQNAPPNIQSRYLITWQETVNESCFSFFSFAV